WVYGLFRALPGERPLLPPLPRPLEAGRIDARVAAPGPHDFAVRRGRFAWWQDHLTPATAIASRAQRYVTMRSVPLEGCRTAGLILQIRILVKRNIFDLGLDNYSDKSKQAFWSEIGIIKGFARVPGRIRRNEFNLPFRK